MGNDGQRKQSILTPSAPSRILVLVPDVGQLPGCYLLPWFLCWTINLGDNLPRYCRDWTQYSYAVVRISMDTIHHSS
jgi:hypothetical protein